MKPNIIMMLIFLTQKKKKRQKQDQAKVSLVRGRTSFCAYILYTWQKKLLTAKQLLIKFRTNLNLKYFNLEVCGKF